MRPRCFVLIAISYDFFAQMLVKESNPSKCTQQGRTYPSLKPDSHLEVFSLVKFETCKQPYLLTYV